MSSINPKRVQNVRELAQHLYPSRDAAGITASTGPTIRTIHGAEVEDMLNFFYDSFHHSGGGAKAGKKGIFGRLKRKEWLIGMRNAFQSKEYVVEAVKDGDKTLGFYFLSKEKDKAEAIVDFFAVSPDIKKSKTAAKTMLTMAKHILEHVKAEGGIDVIKWSTDNKNKRAISLFDKFPADKVTNNKGRTFRLFKKSGEKKATNKKGVTDFTVRVPDFEATLNRYM